MSTILVSSASIPQNSKPISNLVVLSSPNNSLVAPGHANNACVFVPTVSNSANNNNNNNNASAAAAAAAVSPAVAPLNPNVNTLSGTSGTTAPSNLSPKIDANILTSLSRTTSPDNITHANNVGLAVGSGGQGAILNNGTKDYTDVQKLQQQLQDIKDQVIIILVDC